MELTPKKLQEKLQSQLQRRLDGYSVQHLREEAIDISIKLIALANGTGGRNPEYQDGVLSVEYEGRQAMDDFLTRLDEMEGVEGYEIRMLGEDDAGTLAYDSIPEEIRAIVLVYVQEDYIDYGYYEIEETSDMYESADVSDTQAALDEVIRKIKMNSKGVKRIKMKCQKGYKWNPEAKTCEKITGDQLATQRKALRRAALTKKSMGSSFRMRVLRKTRKAMRFRRSMGLSK